MVLWCSAMCDMVLGDVSEISGHTLQGWPTDTEFRAAIAVAMFSETSKVTIFEMRIYVSWDIRLYLNSD